MYQTVNVAFFFLFTVTTVSAIKCYVCKSSKDPMCADPFNTVAAEAAGMLHECSHDLLEKEPTGSVPPQNVTFFCRKGYQLVHGKEHFYRSCGWEPFYVEGRECYYTAVEQVKSTNCECYDNKCNAAGILNVPLLSFLVAAIVPIAFK